MKRKHPLVSLVVVAACALIAVGAATYTIVNTHQGVESAQHQQRLQAHRQRVAEQQQLALIRAQRDGCRRNNVLRAILRAQLHEEIARSKTVHSQDFPGLSSARFHKLIRDQRSDARHDLLRLHTIPCAKKYPRPSSRARQG